VLDRQHVYLLSCTPLEQQQQQQQHVATSTGSAGTAAAAGSSAKPLQLLSCCSVPGASQHQLTSVAWSDGSTVCVGDSEGGCQVLQVIQRELAAERPRVMLCCSCKMCQALCSLPLS
jgi:hypothetical protein